jgi:hypothetical protein
VSIRNQCNDTVAQIIKNSSRVDILSTTEVSCLLRGSLGITSEDYNAVLDINLGPHIN